MDDGRCALGPARPIETKTLFVGLLVGLAHIASGIAVLVAPNALNVTPLATLHDIAQLIDYGAGFCSAILIAAGLMAVIGGSKGLHASRLWRAVMFTPQQTLLFLQLWSISAALVRARFPDGYAPQGGAWFILADQSWAWMLAVSHSIWLAAFIYGGASRGRGS